VAGSNEGDRSAGAGSGAVEVPEVVVLDGITPSIVYYETLSMDGVMEGPTLLSGLSLLVHIAMHKLVMPDEPRTKD
jgi:hypothetical protein